MTTKQKLMKRVLYVITPILMFSTLSAVSYLKNNSEIVSKSQNEAIWFVLQLTKEYSEFIFQLQNYQFGQSDHNDMMIQYEILWSRFNTIVNNSQVMHLDQFKGTLDEINLHFTKVKSLENMLLELPSTQNVKPLLVSFRDDYEDLIIFLNFKFRLSSGDLGDRIQAITETEMIIRYLIITTLLMGGLMAFLLLRESRSHHKLAMNDGLTGIYNRLWLNQKLYALERLNQSFTFYLIDLDGFKPINDTLGHHAGDELLKKVAHRLSHLDSDTYHVARMGGDEFAIIELCSPSTNSQANHPHSDITDLLTEVFAQPFMFAGALHQISASIGVSQFPKQAKSISAVLKQADFAMYEVKQCGKDGLRHFSCRSKAPFDTQEDQPIIG
ncbi:GGDEF domain-containing protein [Photobacterium sp. SDRW27]|uniref:GGDEF domain-containing protein n=1 Tax=Photobacterium obscurum TaxID=2829490 RepID=UPI0022436DA3|nr:GGDEF domain-containing protein [Photobacterium obscurum]MCW8327436.1 GGDEF domain-containing protein [Photobacterium obscurum]